VPTGQSQQRLKAIGKPELSWDEDACTAVAPIGAIIPEAAFRDSSPALERNPPSAGGTSGASDADASSEPVFELARPPSAPRASAVLPKRKALRRWLMLGVAMLLCYVATFGVVSVARKLEQHEARRSTHEPTLSIWDACREVFDDVLRELNVRRKDPGRR